MGWQTALALAPVPAVADRQSPVLRSVRVEPGGRRDVREGVWKPYGEPVLV